MFNFSIKIGGPAGEGIFSTGVLISKYFQKANLNVVYTMDYPSLIKGGHNTCTIRCSKKKIFSEELFQDIIVAFDKLSIEEEFKYLKKGGILICDENNNFTEKNINIIEVPFLKLLGKENYKFKNSFIFGILVGILGKNEPILRKVIKIYFKSKPEEIIQKNIKIALLGLNFWIQNYNKLFLIETLIEDKNNKLLINGNDAASLAAIKAGVKFIAEYPMTPSSSFLSFMAKRKDDFHIITKHVEDEIAAINMVIGASFTGVRSMTATSGGGFALMGEAIAFAGISETPCVIFECQRTGPSTGIPTYTEQSDLKFVLNAGSGEFPLIVLAPGDVEECFYETFDAFNIADLIQTPVVILLDKHIADTKITIEEFNEKNLYVLQRNVQNLNLTNYKRYKFTDTGISPRTLPGEDGVYVSSSYEHDETGWTDESGKNHKLMQEKRFKKLNLIDKKKLIPKLYGPTNADLTLIGWGSTKTSAIDAINILNQIGYCVNYLHFIFINPMDSLKVKKILNNCKDTMILECNYTGQFRDILREKTLFDIKKTFFKYDGRPFFYKEIIDKVKEVLKNE